MIRQFIEDVISNVIIENTALYKDILNNTDIADVTDEYWKKVITLYNSLNDDGKKVILEIMNNASTDAISNFLGILDGVSSLDHDYDIQLKIDDEVPLELQDTFLNFIEEL